jgi:Mrp family chromosome partitioning ATPase
MTRVADATERLLTLAPAETTNRVDSARIGWPSASPYELDTPLLVDLDSAVREEIGRLVQQLFLQPFERTGSAPSSAIRSVVFASAATRTASVTVTAGTAEVLARQTVGSVCVVDADLRNPTMHDCFHLPNTVGLSEALPQDRVTPIAAVQLSRNLSFIPAGFEGSSALHSLGRETFGRTVAELTARFDFVLVNAPPLGAHSDAVGLGASVDGVVLVVEAGSTRRATARRSAEMLRNASGQLVGVVLTNRKFPIPQFLYRWL